MLVPAWSALKALCALGPLLPKVVIMLLGLRVFKRRHFREKFGELIEQLSPQHQLEQVKGL